MRRLEREGDALGLARFREGSPHADDVRRKKHGKRYIDRGRLTRKLGACGGTPGSRGRNAR